MIRLISLAFFAVFLAGCGESKTGAQQLASLNAEVQKLDHHQNSYQERFDEIYQHMKTINQQFPKLNEDIHVQLNGLSKNNHELINQAHKNLEKSFQSVHKEINDFGEALAKAGY